VTYQPRKGVGCDDEVDKKRASRGSNDIDFESPRKLADAPGPLCKGHEMSEPSFARWAAVDDFCRKPNLSHTLAWRPILRSSW